MSIKDLKWLYDSVLKNLLESFMWILRDTRIKYWYHELGSNN